MLLVYSNIRILSNKSQEDLQNNLNREDFVMLYDQIIILCGKTGISIARLERETGLGNGTIRRWKNGSASVDKVMRVADYFAVTVDSLLTRSNPSKDTVQ